MVFNFDTTIHELLRQKRISPRTYHSLASASLETIGGIVDSINDPSDLLKIPGFGPKCLYEFKPILEEAIRDNNIMTPEDKDGELKMLGSTTVKNVSIAYAKFIEGESKIKDYLKEKFSHPYDLHSLMMGEMEDILNVAEGFSREENIMIRELYLQYLEQVIHKLGKTKCSGNNVFSEYTKKYHELNTKVDYFSCEQMAKYFLSPAARKYLKSLYPFLVEKHLNLRCKRLVNDFLPEFEDLLKYADKPYESYLDINRVGPMFRTLEELYQFNRSIFTPSFRRIAALNDNELEVEFIKIDYPFLTSKQMQFISEFIQTYNHRPLFFILLHYLRHSKAKSDYIYSLVNGIIDGKRRTLEEVGEMVGLTKSRIQQIMSKKIDAQSSSVANDADWSFYKDLLKQKIISENSKEYIHLKESEGLPDDFRLFGKLLKLVGKFNFYKLKDTIFLMHNDAHMNIGECLVWLNLSIY